MFRRMLLHLKLLVVLALMVCIAQSPARAQSYHFRNYSVDEGLPFVQVFTIYQDAQGYLWTGGYGGLSKFDGFQFTNYSPLSGLPNHWVTSLAEYENGSLWVGTIEGLSKLENNVFTTYTTKDGLPSDYVTCLIRDERNNLFAGTTKGLAKYDGNKFVSLELDSAFPQLGINCFYQEPNKGKIWIGTNEGVFEYSNGTFTAHPFPQFYDKNIRAISKDKSGYIVAGTIDGIFQLKNDLFQQFIPPSGTEIPSINCMMTDISGILWIGADNGLFTFDGATFTETKISNDPNAEKVVSIFNDFENNVWLGTHSGLFRFRGKGFVSYGIEDGLSSNFIYGITKDNSGQMWFCTESEGVFRYDGNSFTGYGKREGMPSDKTSAVFAQNDGSVLVGTTNGLVQITGNKISRIYTRKDGLYNDSVNVIMQDPEGALWLGGNSGITKFENGKLTSYAIPKNGQSPDVWSMLVDSKGRFWVGTYLGGLFLFENGFFHEAGKEMGINADSYFGICEDRTGKVYFATLDGVYIYNGTEVDSIREQHGMNSDLVYTMGIDRNKNFLWIGTNQGVNKFDVNEYNRSGSKIVYTFGKEEGFSGVECNTNGLFEEENGTIWFGTVNGLVQYNPAKYRPNPYYTKTNITKTFLFYQDTLLAHNAELAYYENSISFEYVGICLTNPSKVRYRYKLEGFETEFSPPTREKIARYSNLPAGQYTFKVISCNNEGLWNEAPAVFTFRIAAPYWKKSWFWLLITTLVVALLTLAIFWRIKQIKAKERSEAEMRVALAGNELKALRAQMNPHFVFNSLNSIQHFILTNKTGDAGKYLNKFARLMRVILNNSEKSSITIREEMEYLQLYMELEAMRFDNKFTWHVDIAEDIDTDYFEIPAMLLQPYVENAILHGLTPRGEGGQLDIILRMQGNNLVCRIKDNGIGRESARDMRQLSGRKDHRSLGMKITSDRLELINNLQGSHLSMTITDLKHEDGTAAGTQVDIFIPVS